MIQTDKPASTSPEDALADRSGASAEAADDTREAAPIRADKVARVKRQLHLNMYDEDVKLDAILDRLVEDVMAFGNQSPDKADASARNRAAG